MQKSAHNNFLLEKMRKIENWKKTKKHNPKLENKIN